MRRAIVRGAAAAALLGLDRRPRRELRVGGKWMAGDVPGDEAAQCGPTADEVLDSLVAALPEASKVAMAGGRAGDEGEPERKRVALTLFRIVKTVRADLDARDPRLGMERRAEARQLTDEAERCARLIARTFTEWGKQP